MHEWIVRSAEEILERIFAILDIEDNVYIYLATIRGELRWALDFLKEEDAGFHIKEPDDVDYCAQDYIVAYQLQEEVTPEKLEQVTRSIFADHMLIAMAEAQRYRIVERKLAENN